MADKCTEKRSNSLIIREQHHQKCTLCYSNRLANTKRFKITSVAQEMKNGTLTLYWWEYKYVQPPWI